MTALTSKLQRWIERDCRLASAQVELIRVVWGLIAVYAALVLIELGYPASRGGRYFNLPLFDWFPLLPDDLHRAVIYLSLPFGLVLLGSRKWSAVASAGMAIVLCYVTISDHMGFRHLWVFFFHIYFLLTCVLLWRRPADSDDSLVPYAVFGFRLFTCLAYVIAGSAKLSPAFATGGVLRELVAGWPHGSLIPTVLDAIPNAYPIAAVASACTELALGPLLMIPSTRRLAYVIGAGFHIMVAVVGRVAPDLNIAFVALYLFFAWNPRDQRAVIEVPAGSRVWALIKSLDSFGRGDWRVLPPPDGKPAVLCSARSSSSNRYEIVRWIASNVVFLNPVVFGYAAFWAYFLLPLEPWAWANHPFLAVLSILALVAYARRARNDIESAS